METIEKAKNRKGTLLTIFVFTFISAAFILYGFFLFFVIGNRDEATWHFGTVEDVPAQSRYSTSATKRFFLNATSPEKNGEVVRQHVMEDTGAAAYVPDSESGRKGNDSE